ncbi:MAG TPA: secretin and TonB N-terminal domain-containing protein [Syntrophales bacterium]|nr:secretin and TonB N-terminal domain-containing protein [Syntrophales bacterium]HQN78413.1 secretin and TonB N-terminal domain-containing protein [Syntrophales bacterium]HQQ27213.1 secretin and TonB N-terminal domain-containing protein [Syntrophales bacterium]
MKRTFLIPAVMMALVGLLLFGCAPAKTVEGTPPPGRQAAAAGGGAGESAASLDGVFLERWNGKERVVLLVQGKVPFDVLPGSDQGVSVRLHGVTVPLRWQGRLGEGTLDHIRHVTATEKTEDGKPAGEVLVVMDRMVPYHVREESGRIVLDFDVPRTSSPAPSREKAAVVLKKAEPAKKASGGKDPAKKATVSYRGRRVSIDLQNAEIQALFRLLSEVSGMNIVLSPEVKGKISLRMQNVPWDQALDTALEVNALGKKVSGSVITVFPLELLKKAEEEELKKNVAEGKIHQISIEAKIVEVNTSFTEKLGVQWGYGYQDTWNGRDFGFLIGTAANGTVTSLPGGIGLTSSNVAVNFPAIEEIAAPTIGLIAGSSKYILDASLSALEVTGDGKIISSPKVTTLDNVKATIGQGEEIPYVVRDNDGNYNVEMKDAKLELQVKPKITPDGKISMEVMASNKYADWNKVNANEENPPLVASNVESTIVVNNGDTLVLGGIYKTVETTAVSGVPWLSKIPVLGWLFKTSTVIRDKKELLIFVTPRIVQEARAT